MPSTGGLRYAKGSGVRQGTPLPSLAQVPVLAKVINFNKARKRKVREDQARQAAENRVRFGRTRQEKDLDRQVTEEAERRMDLLRRESEDEMDPEAAGDSAPAAGRSIEPWAERAMQRWPNVPDLYGWLTLDRRGRWLIRGEAISRPQIIDTINRNYLADERGRWYFQNGPQRGYMQLEATPLILHVSADGRLTAHTGEVLSQVTAAYLDEDGALLVDGPLGCGLLEGPDLDWVLERLRIADRAVDEDDLGAALALPSGSATGLVIVIEGETLPVLRLDQSLAPAALGFVREPRHD